MTRTASSLGLDEDTDVRNFIYSLVLAGAIPAFFATASEAQVGVEAPIPYVPDSRLIPVSPMEAFVCQLANGALMCIPVRAVGPAKECVETQSAIDCSPKKHS